jgi:hypothetical protein
MSEARFDVLLRHPGIYLSVIDLLYAKFDLLKICAPIKTQIIDRFLLDFKLSV